MHINTPLMILIGTPAGARTLNLLVRNQMLYPIELQVRVLHPVNGRKNQFSDTGSKIFCNFFQFSAIVEKAFFDFAERQTGFF